MRIWLVTIGEPIMHPENKLRLHRTGILAKIISQNSTNEIVWWTSTFNHFTKRHMYDCDTYVNVNDNLKMIALKGKGYNKNVSINRIIDHNQIAKNFYSKASSELKPDIIVVSFPTLGLAEKCIKYGKCHSVPVLIDYRDMWPEVFLDLIPQRFKIFGKILLFNLIGRTNRVFSEATGIIGITDEFLQLGLKKSQRARTLADNVFPLAYLTNQFTKQEFLDAEVFWKKKGISKSQINICFFGTLGYQFNFDAIIEAAEVLMSEKINFIICGSGDKYDDLVARSKNVSNVFLPGFVTAAQIKALMEISKFGLCPYIPKEAFINSIPGKAIEYISSGLFILNTLGDGVLGKMLEKNSFGESYVYNQSSSLVNCILKSIRLTENSENLQIRIKEYFENQFSANSVYLNYLEHLDRVVKL